MFPTHRVVLIVLVLWTHGLAWAQPDWPPCEAPHDGALQAGPLDYVVVEPPDVKADTPVVVMVHGLGHDNNGFIPFARGFGLPYRLVLPNAPRTYKKGFSWYRVRCQGSVTDVLESTKRLLALFRRLKKRWPKAGKPHVVGFSQGGVMGMSLAARYPDKVAGVVALSGYLVPLDLTIAKRKRKTPPVWIAHGRRDTVVLFSEGLAAHERFKAAGYSSTFVPHDRFHAVPPSVVQRAGQWIRDRLKRP